MNDPVIERVAREDPAAGAGDRGDHEVMFARLMAAIDEPARRSPRRLGGRVAGALGITCVVAVIAAVALVLVGHHRAAPVRPVHQAAPSTGRLTLVGSMLARSGAVSALLSHGSLWVATATFVARVDPRSGALLHRIPIPSSGVGPAQLASGAGSIWVAYQGSPPVLRIDPATNRVVAQVDHGRLSSGGGAAFADGHLWMSRDGSHPRSDVVEIDPGTNQVTGKPIRVGTGPGTIASGFGSLWVDNTSEPHARMSRINLRTRRMSYLPFGGQPFKGYGSIWAIPFQDPARIRRYTPGSRAPLATLNVARAATVGFGFGRVWVGSYPKSSSPKAFKAIPGTARLTEIDPQSDRVMGRPVHLPGTTTPGAIVVAGDNLWITDYDSGLLHFRIDH
jgi:hypothetical protein